MRTGKVTADEIQAAEKAQDDRREKRNMGLSKASERDQGWARLYDLNNKQEIFMEWHVPQERRMELTPYSGISDTMFSLKVNGKLLVFDTEEFRKSLRWA